jgi:hypothetical protein
MISKADTLQEVVLGATSLACERVGRRLVSDLVDRVGELGRPDATGDPIVFLVHVAALRGPAGQHLQLVVSLRDVAALQGAIGHA